MISFFRILFDQFLVIVFNNINLKVRQFCIYAYCYLCTYGFFIYGLVPLSRTLPDFIDNMIHIIQIVFLIQLSISAQQTIKG